MKKKLPEYQSFLEAYLIEFNLNMKNIDVEINEYDLEIYRIVIKRSVNSGINLSGSDIITLHFNRTCYKNRNLDIDYFKGIFPEEYTTFIVSIFICCAI
ncbi:hypothetical protein [uncultured Clostridium sp.]|uniref:hypothetical protein n=1 Tax=uncultured Clostridium sp. TaxID=59620 RepID=UPI0028EBBA8C|nr:hypothetical protein [uncultured Clostridium sp.]